MGEGIRHHAALRLALQRVVADGRRRLHRRVDVARLNEFGSLFLQVCPNAAETIGLQLDAHLNAVGCRPASRLLLLALSFLQNAKLVLHMMPDLMGDHIGLREFARLAAAATEAVFDFLEEGSVEINDAVSWAVEGSHLLLRNAATPSGGAREQTQPR